MKKLKKIVLFIFLFLFLSISSVTVAVSVNRNKNPNTKISSISKVSSIVKEKVKPVRPENLNNINGTITIINGNSITITLEQKGNKKDKIKTKIIVVDTKTQINKDLTKITLADLKVGDTVRIDLEQIGKSDYRVRSIRVVTNETNNIIKQIRAKTTKI